jgi:hypothetical protein
MLGTMKKLIMVGLVAASFAAAAPVQANVFGRTLDAIKAVVSKILPDCQHKE